MIEHCYIITSESPYHSEYFKQQENKKAINEAFKRFTEEHGISAKQYVPSSELLSIIPTKSDEEKFSDQLTKAGKMGLRRFKKTSQIGKAWKQLELKPLKKLHVPFFFQDVYEVQYTRLFDYKGVVYCTIENSCNEMVTPRGFKQIQRSEFFKIVEEIESENMKEE